MLAPAEAVWDVLADANTYGYWVVGSKVIRDVDPDWPVPGSKFHHTVGFGPFKVSDHTVALDSRRPHLFEIRAKARPAGVARVRMEMHPRAGGTDVHMTEYPDGPFLPMIIDPMFHLLVHGRNAESLMRLEELAVLEAERTARAGSRERGRALSST